MKISNFNSNTISYKKNILHNEDNDTFNLADTSVSKAEKNFTSNAKTSQNIPDDVQLKTFINGLDTNSNELDLTNTINWNSSGNSKITYEQIAILKSKYDINNLSGQDYYNLLADLTNMDIISGQDLKNQILTPGIEGITPYNQLTQTTVNSKNTFTILDAISNTYKNLKDTFNVVGSKEYLSLNANINYQDYSNYLQTASETIASYEKISNIIALIK